MSETTTDQLDPEAGFTSTPTVSEAANDLRAAAGEKAKDIIHGAEAKANKFREVASKQADQFKTVASEQWETTRVRAKELHVSAEDYIRENPTKCVLGALGIGFIAGLIMRR